MPTPRSAALLILALFLVLGTACAANPISTLPALQPTALPLLTPPAPQPTQSDGAGTVPGPSPAPKPTRAAGASANNNQGGSSASQNLAFDVPAHPVDVILGRPTNNSIVVSVLAYQDAEGYIEYGPASDSFASQTALTSFKANQPAEILIAGLQASASYTYRLRYRSGSAADFSATEGETFSTQRTAGSSFTFDIQADSHLDTNSSLPVYLQTLANELSDQPDFLIDLGDTFMTDKYTPYTDAELQYLAQRYYLSLVGRSAPLFLVLGNHDGEGAPKGSSGVEMSFWAAQLRKLYFSNPVPDGFYTGNATPAQTAGLLQNYYAWEWGDALFVVLDPYWFTPPQGGETNLWNPTLGDAQYQWLKSTLEASRAQWKFVFIHQLIGGADKNGRGGVEVVGLYEWGGLNADGSSGFAQQRPGWAMPIHQLLAANQVTAVFHGHDHLFIKQELDGIIYQEVPQPSAFRSNGTNSAAEYGYLSGDILGSSGHLRVTVSPEQVQVEYVRVYLPQDKKSGQQNGQVDYVYQISRK